MYQIRKNESLHCYEVVDMDLHCVIELVKDQQDGTQLINALEGGKRCNY
jgi:hypothetical protein